MNLTVEQIEDFLLTQGIEKLSISSPVYTMRDEPTRETERGMWQVSIKSNEMQLEWKRGKWKPTLAEALTSCLGEISEPEKASFTELLV